MKADLAWNRMYLELYNRTKKIIKKEETMKFYDASRPIYMEADGSGVGLGAQLPQVRDGMNCGHDKIPYNATQLLLPTEFF